MTGEARTNREGSPCPSWCMTDHDKKIGRDVVPDLYDSDHRAVPMRVFVGKDSHADIGIQKVGRKISAYVFTPDLASSMAEYGENELVGMSILIGQLADASPEDHEHVAAALRKAAAKLLRANDE